MLSFLINSATAQQVTELITDFGGFWKSDTLAPNPVLPNTSHNVLSFKYRTARYSTGVNDAKLTANSLTYTAADFRAFPVTTVGGTIIAGNSTFIALASNYDGNPNGYSNPFPSLKVRDVLIDGLHGLDLGTGVTNIPASALINFPVSSIIVGAIADSIPDILVSQIASPSNNGDTLYFVNSSGIVVGNKVRIDWTIYKLLGNYSLDLYTMPNNSLCDTAKISGTSAFNTTREIRMIAFRLSEFGITAGNASDVSNFILKASGTSDPAFIAYNAGAFTIPAPVITVQPLSQIICPNLSNSVTLSVTATGASLSYQWRKNGVEIPGATGTTYTISNVVTSSAGTYDVVVSNSAGSISSNLAYLNISIAVQPFPSSQDIATGASATITVSANNATSYQWKIAGVDIPGAHSASYVINPVTSISATNYSVQIINSAGGGCANILSSAVTVTGKTTLYSKAAGNLNVPGTWGVVPADGTGSSPVDFTRAEHTFIVKSNASTGGNLTIAGKLDVSNAVTTITGGTTFDSRSIIRSGSGSLAGSTTSDIIVRDTSNLYFKRGNNVLHNISVYGGKVTLLDSLSITGGSLAGTIALYGGTLVTGDSLTFKSDNLGTASLAPITGGAVIIGKTVVERYISARRAWRFLSIPTSTTQTIKQAWQEGAINKDSNLVKGFGTQITGSAGTAAGFDLYTATPSMKTYNPVTNIWTGVPATNLNIQATEGYMVFIRGDRTATTFSSPVTQTVMRTYGTLHTGDQTPMLVNAGKFASIGNPYASGLDMRNISKFNMKDFFYVWDPKLGGTYGVGAYQTFSNNGSNYVVTPGSGSYGITGSVNNFIESGQAFLVQANATGGSLSFTENSKIGGTAPVSRSAGLLHPQLRTSLYGVNADSSTYMIDGVLSNYEDSYSNTVDDMDAIKSVNASENLSIKTGSALLAIERRHSIIKKDTIFLDLANTKVQQYRFQFTGDQLDRQGLTGFLEDNYLHTSTPLSLSGNTFINFNIANIPGSYATDRFRIVFIPALVLPLSFTSIKAYQENKEIAVEWKVENEMNTAQYETERSGNGTQFTSLSVTNATGNAGHSASYRVTDAHPSGGYNYYRIKSMDINGRIAYSGVVKVFVGKGSQEIIVYPNPLIDEVISIQLNNMPAGKYSVKLLNNLGQKMLDKIIQHTKGSSTELITIDKNMPHGIYQLEITKPGNEMITNKLIH